MSLPRFARAGLSRTSATASCSAIAKGCCRAIPAATITSTPCRRRARATAAPRRIVCGGPPKVAGRVLLHRGPLQLLREDPRMKAPDLTSVEDAGVRAWSGSIEPLRAAAKHARARVLRHRPVAREGSRGTVRRARHVARAARSLRPQLGRARGRARGPRLARQARARDRVHGRRRVPPRASDRLVHARGHPGARPRSSGRSATSRSGCSRRRPRSAQPHRCKFHVTRFRYRRSSSSTRPSSTCCSSSAPIIPSTGNR